MAPTLALICVLVGTPGLIINRLLNGALPLRSFDFVLVMLVVLWVQLCKAVIQRDEPLQSLTQQRFSLEWQADNLVAQSLLGAGLASSPEAKEPDLFRVQKPSHSVASLLPPVVEVEATTGDGDDSAAPRRLIPSLPDAPASDGPEILATEEYTIARGDTFWSISEYAFGDGRHWQKIQQINLGREVAPGVMLDDSHELRIGWSVLIPLVEAASETSDDPT